MAMQPAVLLLLLGGSSSYVITPRAMSARPALRNIQPPMPLSCARSPVPLASLPPTANSSPAALPRAAKRAAFTATTAVLSLIMLGVRGAIAASRSSSTAGSVNVAKWVVIGGIAGGFSWWANRNPPAERWEEDEVIPEENPERIAALAAMRGSLPPEQMEDSFLMGDLQSRMEEIVSQPPPPSPPAEESGRDGGTAMIDRPSADGGDGQGGASATADELPSPPPGEDWGVETEPAQDADSIAMLQRMFGEDKPEDDK